MSDLEAAIAAEMRLAGCSPSKVDDCREHPNDGRWSDRDACPIVAAAVRAGWNAAINAAAEKAHNEGMRAFNASTKHEPGSHAESRCIGGVGASYVIRDGISALLSEGGGRG